MNAKSLGALLACVALLCASGVQAQARAGGFPTKPVTIVVPFGPGGTSDAISRIIGQELGKKWKQQVIIENKAGGQTIIGTEAAAKAAPNGHTLGFVTYSWTANQLLVKSLPYATADLAPVALIGRQPLALYVNGDVPVQSMAEFVAYAKKAGRPITFGHAGAGSSSHIAALEFADLVGIQALPVGYKNGTVGAVTDLVGGRIDALFEGRTYKQFVDDKRLKALALAAPARLANWSDLPSAPEAGYPELDIAGYFGLMVPARTPKAIRDQISTDVAEILKDEQVQQRLLQVGLQPQVMTPAQFEEFLAAQRVKFGGLYARHREQMID